MKPRPKRRMNSVVERMLGRAKARRALRRGASLDTAAPISEAGCSKAGRPKPRELEIAASESTAWRIAGALGTTPQELAVLLDVHPVHIAEMFKGTSGTSPIVAGHPAWHALGKLVDEQLGLLMGVQAEIQGKRELDAKRLLERMERSKL